MAASADLRFLYGLALRLGKSLGEILDLPREEVAGWAAYLEWQAQQKGR